MRHQRPNPSDFDTEEDYQTSLLYYENEIDDAYERYKDDKD